MESYVYTVMMMIRGQERNPQKENGGLRIRTWHQADTDSNSKSFSFFHGIEEKGEKGSWQ